MKDADVSGDGLLQYKEFLPVAVDIIESILEKYQKDAEKTAEEKDKAREIISMISTNHSIKKGILMKSLRIAFFGCLSGPDLIQSWELFSENELDIALIKRCLI